MTPRGAILQLAKMVSQDMGRGAASPGALAAGPMLAQAGATPDLVACLIAEASKNRPADRIVEACCFLLEGALGDLRIAGNGGDTAARAGLAEACQAIETAVTSHRLAPKVLMLIARAFAQAGLEPGAALKQATLAAMEAGVTHDSAPPGRGDLAAAFAPLAGALGHDPFAIHAEIAASGAAFPPEHRAAMAAELAGSEIDAVREAALGFLLDADPAPGAAVLDALAATARRHAVPSRMVERLVSLRPWLPLVRQPKLDVTIRALRAHTAPPVARSRDEIRMLLASLCDGAGAQSLFSLLVVGRRFALASVLIKSDVGVADAWVREDMPKREADSIIARITAETEAVRVPIDFVARRLSDALATNLATDTPPPFGLLQVTEALGLGLLRPTALAAKELAEDLLRDLPSDQTGPEATRQAHVDAADWPQLFDTVASWFEAGEEVEALLRPIPSRRRRAAAARDRLLPGRRQFWAERCAWMAATLKDAGSDEGDEWVNFALVARDLAREQPLSEVPLFDVIAEATVDAYTARSRTRRK